MTAVPAIRPLAPVGPAEELFLPHYPSREWSGEEKERRAVRLTALLTWAEDPHTPAATLARIAAQAPFEYAASRPCYALQRVVPSSLVSIRQANTT